MKRKLVISIAIAAVLAAAVAVFVIWLRSGEETAPESDRTLELFTIMGSVPLSEREVPGRWRLARGAAAANLTEKEREQLEKLHALPYLQGTQKAPELEGVTVFDREHAFDGVNLFNSGHAPEAYAMDMEGRMLHTWRFDVADVWPHVPHTLHSEFWRRAYWYPNGDVLVIFEGIGMIKIDKDSNLLWKYDEACHHQATVTDDGTIYVLTRRADTLPRINPDAPVLEDAIDILTPDGERIDRCSVLEAVENSRYKQALRYVRKLADLFHTNSIYVFDGSLEHLSRFYKKGNVLVSILTLDTIGIIDIGERRMVWAYGRQRNTGWAAQHDVIALESGRMLLFDNRGYRDKSRVLEFDPYSRTIPWQYVGSEEHEFYSKTCGTNQRLPNGNTLITESDNGRAFEITREKKIVWEFYSPFRAGNDNEFIATLFELRRVPTDSMGWLRTDEPGTD
jgi:hypothetical protein